MNRPHRLAGALRIARFLLVAWWLQMKMRKVARASTVLLVIWPVFFSTIALLIYRQSGDSAGIVFAGLGSAMMGTWSTVVNTASTALQRERWLGTLELFVSTPMPFACTLLPITAAMATMGLYNMVATLAWGYFVFHIELSIAAPVTFVIAVLVSIASMSLFGFLLAVTAVRYRSAWALGNLLEYPGFLLCGFLVPVAVLPSGVQWISKAVPLTWATLAVRRAAAGDPAQADLVVCAVLSAVVGALAAVLAGRLLRSARVHGSLVLR